MLRLPPGGNRLDLMHFKLDLAGRSGCETFQLKLIVMIRVGGAEHQRSAKEKRFHRRRGHLALHRSGMETS
jgi:hypothetical protein